MKKRMRSYRDLIVAPVDPSHSREWGIVDVAALALLSIEVAFLTWHYLAH